MLQNLKPYERDEIIPCVRKDKLLKELEQIIVTNRSGVPIPWHKTPKCITIDKMCEFFVGVGDRWVSRKELAKFLRNNSKSDSNKYKTAGDYLKILIENRI